MFAARQVLRSASRLATSHTSSAASALPALHLLVRPGMFTHASFSSSSIRFQDQKPSDEGMSTSPDKPEEGEAAEAKAENGAGAAGAGEDAVKALKDENAKLKAQVQELNASRLRLLAEMENVRRIAIRDVEQAKSYALQSFGKKILDVADNLQRAIASVPAEARVRKEGNEAMATLFEGIAATEKEMIKTLASGGIEQFGKPGEKFDPNRHEAMMQVPATDKAPEGTVTLILKNGFTLKDRVLRAAQVAVATKM
jgi:molecular chaperone GrpE